MKLALAQINTTIGDFTGNVRKVAAMVRKACAAGVDLVVFPELTLCGYPPRDLVESPAFVKKNQAALETVACLARGIAVIVGYVARSDRPGQKPLTNSLALCEEGSEVWHYDKRLLPTYDVFDEGRHFAAGGEVGIYPVAGRKIGFSICEDAWNDAQFWPERLYHHDPIEAQVQAGAELLINMAASPYARGKSELRTRMFQALSRRHRVPCAIVNLVGANDELVFDGRSLVIDARGEIAHQGKSFAEDLVVVDLEHLTTVALPHVDDIADISQALILGVKDYVRKCGFQKVVLGLSGGIDSSLVALIATRALGPKNVLGVAMPSPYSSPNSLEDARELACNLGIQFQVIPITLVYQSYRKLLKSKTRPDLADENIQARIRGNILMALSNRYGSLVLSTGNKSELSVGYCTLYGDMSGGLAVISDLPKTVVYEVTRHLNKKAVIPERVFTKVPTAELRPNQTDQDSLPPYDLLDAILGAVIEEHKSEADLLEVGFDPKVVRKVLRLVEQNEYKRRQAAPGLKLTSKAFGIGRRYPIARKI